MLCTGGILPNKELLRSPIKVVYIRTIKVEPATERKNQTHTLLIAANTPTQHFLPNLDHKVHDRFYQYIPRVTLKATLPSSFLIKPYSLSEGQYHVFCGSRVCTDVATRQSKTVKHLADNKRTTPRLPSTPSSFCTLHQCTIYI